MVAVSANQLSLNCTFSIRYKVSWKNVRAIALFAALKQRKPEIVFLLS